MAQICLADFLDLVSRAGPSKLTKVKQLKHRPPYRPGFDFYRPLRAAITETHRAGGNRDTLEHAVLSAISADADERQRTGLPPVLQGYKHWWGRKELAWFDPPRGLWRLGDVEVLVNPDLGLEIDGRPHVVKLYFKDEPLAKRTVDVVLHLMQVALIGPESRRAQVGILDVRRGKLLVPTVDVPNATAQLFGECAYLSAAWGEV